MILKKSTYLLTPVMPFGDLLGEYSVIFRYLMEVNSEHIVIRETQSTVRQLLKNS